MLFILLIVCIIASYAACKYEKREEIERRIKAMDREISDKITAKTDLIGKERRRIKQLEAQYKEVPTVDLEYEIKKAYRRIDVLEREIMRLSIED